MIDNNIDKKRVKILIVIVFLVSAYLLSGLIWIQLVDGQEYAKKAVYNSLRFLSIPATRGNMFDINGEVVVNSTSGYTINVTYISQEQTKEVVNILAPLMLDKKLEEEFLIESEYENIEDNNEEYLEYVKANSKFVLEELKESIHEIIETQRYYRRYEPIRIAPISGKTIKEVDMKVVAAIEGSRTLLPNVSVEVQPIRQYKLQDYAFHIIGSINQIDRVGNDGLERSFDDYLSGEDGRKLVEVNVSGRPTSAIGEIEPTPGSDLYLTIDSKLQKVAEDALMRSIEKTKQTVLSNNPNDPEKLLPNSGAVVVMDVNTGAVLASASIPQVDRDNYAYYSSQSALNDELIRRFSPMMNKVTSSTRPPGSVMKPLIGLAALENNFADANTTIYCDGTYHGVNNTWSNYNVMYCWDRSGHGGPIDIRAGLKNSCNLYFYPLGEKMGLDLMKEYYDKFGFDRFVSLTTGNISTRELFTSYGNNPMPADLAQLAIGQGATSVNPLQIVQFVSVLANAEINAEGNYVGKLYKPYLVEKIVDEATGNVENLGKEVIDEIIIDKESLDLIRGGMKDVIMERGGEDGNTGTGYWQFHQGNTPIFPFEIAGKTGTSQEVGWGNHGWFIAYAPYDNPEIAVAVLVEQGRSGGSTGGPVAKEIFLEYFADILD
ncbi:MAG: peptidoglycan D,D-transpeptidase FtsI family protein [Clostridia bacterium]